MEQLGLILAGYSEFSEPLEKILLKYDIPEFYKEGFDYLEVLPLMQLAGAHVNTVPLGPDDVQLVVFAPAGHLPAFCKEFERLLRTYYERRATGRLDVLDGGGGSGV